MKTKFNVFIAALAMGAMLSFSGCSKEDEVASCSYDSELSTYEQKLNAFSQNPNPSNCNSLKDAALKLINKIGSCAEGASIKEAAEAWRKLDCSGYSNL